MAPHLPSGLPGLAKQNKSTKKQGCPAEFEFQINNKKKNFFRVSMSHEILGTYLY